MVLAFVLAWAGPARADRITVGAVSLESPPGFRVDGARLLADGGIWAFADPADATDLDAWMAAAWKRVAASFTDVQPVQMLKQTLPGGFVIAIQGATAGDAQGHDHYLMFVGAYRPDLHRVYPSLFDASTSERYQALSPVVGKALATIAVASAPAKPSTKPAPPAKPTEPTPPAEPAKVSLPDGRYGCQTMGYGIGGSPAVTASPLGYFVLSNGTYDSPSYKGGGKTKVTGNRIGFVGGPFDGWVAAIERATSTVYFRFGQDHKDPGDRSQVGDHLCYLQK